MEGSMMRVTQGKVLESFVLIDEPVSDDLNLRLVRDRLKVRMQDGALGI
jgi:hypothetical protein